MDPSVLSWGLDIVRSVQTIASPVLTGFMIGVTFLGEEAAYLLAAGILLWCIDAKKGNRMGIAIILAGFLNIWLKNWFAQPRPYELDSSVKLWHTAGYGLPSWHAQGSLTFWGIAASWIKKPWNVLIAVSAPLLIGLSRLYLGMHFPTDVLAGWLLGLLTLVVYYFLGGPIDKLIDRLDARMRLALAAAISLIMNFLSPGDVSMSGAFLGFSAGGIFAENGLRFDARGTPVQKLLRLLIGVTVIAGLYLGLKAVFPAEGENQYALFQFLRYGFIGAWASYGAPWVFLKLKLAKSMPVSERIE
jgi:membrane-associated phospholipid phosphatase